jgi:long-chain acyl-CoA synthetase
MKGYYRRPESTRNALRGGWLHTGDIGWMDGEGYCFFVKTRKCMINYGGNKIYPRETERLISVTFPLNT